jgi:hypothetical protein
MVRAGYAWWHERYAPESQVLDDCPVEAHKAPKSLWEDEEPMSPWRGVGDDLNQPPLMLLFKPS